MLNYPQTLSLPLGEFPAELAKTVSDVGDAPHPNQTRDWPKVWVDPRQQACITAHLEQLERFRDRTDYLEMMASKLFASRRELSSVISNIILNLYWECARQAVPATRIMQHLGPYAKWPLANPFHPVPEWVLNTEMEKARAFGVSEEKLQDAIIQINYEQGVLLYRCDFCSQTNAFPNRKALKRAIKREYERALEENDIRFAQF